MKDDNERIISLVKKAAIDPVEARVKAAEERLKKHEVVLKDVLEIQKLKDEVKHHDLRLDQRFASEKRQGAFERAALTKSYTDLVNIEITKMDKKLAKTELLEARIQGLETMMRAMEQTIDMLQRRR